MCAAVLLHNSMNTTSGEIGGQGIPSEKSKKRAWDCIGMNNIMYFSIIFAYLQLSRINGVWHEYVLGTFVICTLNLWMAVENVC